MLCSFLLFTDQLRMQTLHCDTLLMTETADVLFSLLISLCRVPLIKKRLFGRGGGGGDTSVNFYRVCTTSLKLFRGQLLTQSLSLSGYVPFYKVFQVDHPKTNRSIC